MFYNDNAPDMDEMSGGHGTQTQPDIFPYTPKGYGNVRRVLAISGEIGEGVWLPHALSKPWDSAARSWSKKTGPTRFGNLLTKPKWLAQFLRSSDRSTEGVFDKTRVVGRAQRQPIGYKQRHTAVARKRSRNLLVD